MLLAASELTMSLCSVPLNVADIHIIFHFTQRKHD